MEEIILVINPGSTTTKIAVYDADIQRYQTTLQHNSDDLQQFPTIASQFSFRKEAIKSNLAENNVDINSFDIIIGRGGLIYPLESGIYEVNEAMQNDLITPPMGEHASNLGALIAKDIAIEISNNKASEVKAYIADPVVVDEMQDVAKISGHPNFKRLSIFHALNQKAVARRYAKERKKNYEELNLIVAHLGGGVSVGAHRYGKVVDVNNALDGEGAMSPERSGTLPSGQLVKLCFSGKYTQKEISSMIKGEGGLVAHTGTNNTRELLDRMEQGDLEAKLVIDAMCYQVGKSIAAMAAVLKGRVDGIILTGGIAYSEYVTNYIQQMVGWISLFKVYGGEDEMGALAENALLVLRGELSAKEYLSIK